MAKEQPSADGFASCTPTVSRPRSAALLPLASSASGGLCEWR
jgi:hypothetical protein